MKKIYPLSVNNYEFLNLKKKIIVLKQILILPFSYMNFKYSFFKCVNVYFFN